ncbi:MAG: DNA repair protein RecN [Thermodesulfovibrionales bacterium]|nr:DNA repair protein RecN [Thermodesulfovibrionales bacterium]
MLRELRVKDFAIIDMLTLRLGPGLNVLTGETGAGKSIIIGALGIALGERAYSEMIKTGSASASVEAYFEAAGSPLFEPAHRPGLEAMGIEAGEGIILRRDIPSSGKGRAYVNDTMVSVQSLSEIGRRLVDIHGQHEHQSLLQGENQMSLLDIYGKLEPEREKVRGLFAGVQAMKKRLEDLKSGSRERAQRVDLLKFQAGEIEAAGLSPGEKTSLEEEKAVLLNISRLKEFSEAAYEAVYGSEGSCSENLSAAISKLKEMSSIDHAASEPLGMLESALPLVQEASSSLRAARDRYNLDPARLTEVDDRLDLIKTLMRKYGDTVEAVLEYKDKIQKELQAAESSDEDKEAIEAELREKEEALIKSAGALSEKRKKAAGEIEMKIGLVLRELALEKADFRIDVKEAGLSSSGADAVEFMFSANPGEALKPLAKVASGGELSRIMLAVKGVLRDADDIPVLIFDEVDAGIGGKTADNVARKLKDLSRGRQVICISHLPQIASAADSHLLIEKKEIKGRVNVTIKKLSGGERKEEIARMLSGKVTEASLRHAGELMERN